jgi:hypothetical protein
VSDTLEHANEPCRRGVGTQDVVETDSPDSREGYLNMIVILLIAVILGTDVLVTGIGLMDSPYKSRARFFLSFGLSCACYGSVAGYGYIIDRAFLRRAIQVEGTVVAYWIRVDKDPNDGEESFFLAVRYRYPVATKDELEHQTNLEGESELPRDANSSRLERLYFDSYKSAADYARTMFDKGWTVEVRYDPAAPSCPTLYRSAPDSPTELKFLALIGLGFNIAVFLLFICTADRKPNEPSPFLLEYIRRRSKP